MAKQQAKAAREAKALTPAKTEWTHNEITDILTRAQTGDKQAYIEGMRILVARPDVLEIMEELTDDMRGRLVRYTYGKENALMVTVLQGKANKMERDLMGKQPSQLERMLCERVATCWLAVQLAEIDAVQVGITLTKAAFHDKRLALAHKRHLQAIETLARVRRLQVPMQQINIAQPGAQQLNIATQASAENLPEKAISDHAQSLALE